MSSNIQELLLSNADGKESYTIVTKLSGTRCDCDGGENDPCTKESVVVEFADFCTKLNLHPDHPIVFVPSGNYLEILSPGQNDDHVLIGGPEDELASMECPTDYDNDPDPLAYHRAVYTRFPLYLHRVWPAGGFSFQGVPLKPYTNSDEDIGSIGSEDTVMLDFPHPPLRKTSTGASNSILQESLSSSTSSSFEGDQVLKSIPEITDLTKENHDKSSSGDHAEQAWTESKVSFAEENHRHPREFPCFDSNADGPQPLYLTSTANEVFDYLKYGFVYPWRLRGRGPEKQKKRKAFAQNARRRFLLRTDEHGRDLLLFQGDYQTKARVQARSVPSIVRKKIAGLKVVPLASEVERIIREDHTAHHDGHNNAEHRLGMKYHIHRLRQKVQEVCGRNCPICSQWEAPPKTGHMAILTSRIAQLLMFDLTMSPLLDVNGLVWILALEDHFTKYLWTKALRSKEAKPIAEFLVELFTSHVRVPERFHCDNGGEFKNKYMDAARLLLAQSCDISGKMLPLSHSLPRNPQCQGLIERKNRSIKENLLKAAEEQGHTDPTKPIDLEKALRKTTMQLNRQIYKPYGVSPYVMQHGAAAEAPDHEALSPGDLSRLHRYAAAAQERQAANVKPIPFESFMPGDFVLVRSLRDKSGRKTKGLDGRKNYPSKAHVDKESISSAGWYHLIWETKGLSGEKPGAKSTRLYHFSRLRKVLHDHTSKDNASDAASLNASHASPKLDNIADERIDDTTTTGDAAHTGHVHSKAIPMTDEAILKEDTLRELNDDLDSFVPAAKKLRTAKSESNSYNQYVSSSSDDDTSTANIHYPEEAHSTALSDFPDMGGKYVSVDAMWFNRTAKWISTTYADPKNTFFVAYVAYSDVEKKRHVMCIWGDRTTFLFDHKKCEECLQRFHEHGNPSNPVYTWGSADELLKSDATVTQPKKQKTLVARYARKQQNERDGTKCTLKHIAESIDWGVQMAKSAATKTRSAQRFPSLLSRLKATHEKVTVYRQTWSWANNSCHLDTWLMTQLTLYAWLGESELTDQAMLIKGDDATRKLFRVLLALGTESQDKVRDSYWAMECSTYDMGVGARGNGFHQFDTVTSHEEQLASAMPRSAANRQRKLVTMTRRSCSNEDHQDSIKNKSMSFVYVTNGWYSMPSKENLSQTQDGSWEAGVAEHTQFRTMRDVLGNLIARQRGGLMKCMHNNCIPALHYRTEDKLPTETTFPWFLTFACDNGEETFVQAEDEFSVAELTYILVCVIFCNNTHFNCNFRRPGTEQWFHYDDMGSKMARIPSCRGNHRVHSLPLKRAPTDPIECSSGPTFYPVQWHYVLASPVLTDQQCSVTCVGMEDDFMHEFEGHQHHEIAAVLDNPDN